MPKLSMGRVLKPLPWLQNRKCIYHETLLIDKLYYHLNIEQSSVDCGSARHTILSQFPVTFSSCYVPHTTCHLRVFCYPEIKLCNLILTNFILNEFSWTAKILYFNWIDFVQYLSASASSSRQKWPTVTKGGLRFRLLPCFPWAHCLALFEFHQTGS